MLRDLVLRNRSTRRFEQKHPVPIETLRELVDMARLSASGANTQPLKYILSAVPATNARIFPHLRWAAYLADWSGPAEGERPAAYCVILWDGEIGPNKGSLDPGIAAQTIFLGATEHGLAGCMIASIDREGLRATLSIDPRFEIVLVLAIGRPAERVQIEDLAPGGDHRYWRTPDGIHHVPKRRLRDLIVAEYPG